MQIPWSFIIGLGIILVLFLVFRTVTLWYWKIDKIVKLLKEIADNLKKRSKEEEK